MAIEATLEGVLRLAPRGSVSVTDTVKLVDVVSPGVNSPCWWAASCPSTTRSNGAGAGVAGRVFDVGSVDGEDVRALGGGQGSEPIDLVRVARDKRERGAGGRDRLTVVGQEDGCRSQAARVDRR